MLIVSQDREAIINFDNISDISINGTDIECKTNNTVHILGTYLTFGKAKKY